MYKRNEEVQDIHVIELINCPLKTISIFQDKRENKKD